MQTFTKLTRCLGIPIKQCTLQSSHIPYQNRTIGGNCLIFSNRKISCNRACSDFWCEEVENVCAYFTKTGLLRAYKRGTPRHRLYRLQIIRTHKREVAISRIPDFQYNPELFSAAIQRQDIHFTSPTRLHTYYRYQAFQGFEQCSVSNNSGNGVVSTRSLYFNNIFTNIVY